MPSSPPVLGPAREVTTLDSSQTTSVRTSELTPLNESTVNIHIKEEESDSVITFENKKKEKKKKVGFVTDGLRPSIEMEVN